MTSCFGVHFTQWGSRINNRQLGIPTNASKAIIKSDMDQQRTHSLTQATTNDLKPKKAFNQNSPPAKHQPFQAHSPQRSDRHANSHATSRYI
ncbi:hypothetical protein BDV38DRAFT_95297 [Aspergillus pseudotamarii]|uniref:Uncharacterized protein n=1 Tax=Aspergillus pseudotamarii TaxID=132259 RepID=A0A5N6T9J7_ASPPS|nr:uncharacterized protein BDV38DRAFT_95297 [Aspergillus pseudotamarii]KAE8142966.1 hypothetical protein BDV38DRAFT_95297 [Aspergillus pseudotamarii]